MSDNAVSRRLKAAGIKNADEVGLFAGKVNITTILL